MKPLVTIEGLKTHFFTDDGVVKAVDGVSFVIGRGETVALVGESGSGKSITAFSTIRLIDHPGKIIGGRIILHGEEDIDLTTLDPRGSRIRDIRGKRIAMIFQEPMSSLSPVHTVGNQILEAILLHTDRNKVDGKKHAVHMMERMGIPNAAERYDAYPHELSGGLRQRAMIAMALSCDPDLLIADEPTTALDVTIQAQILELLNELKAEQGMSILFITHDLGVVAQIADRVVVMYLGEIVEHGETMAIFEKPRHTYTKMLLGSMPDLKSERRGSGKNTGDNPPLLIVENLKKYYPFARGPFYRREYAEIKAVDDVSFNVGQGECLGLVGESGCGKTTVGHCILRAHEPTSGSVRLRVDDQFREITGASKQQLHTLRGHMGIIFQDPFSSLDPRMTVEEIIGEPLLLNGMKNRNDRLNIVRDLLVKVGLTADQMIRFPHAFSGGQRQRISIARTLTLNPAFIMCDEPVSALDVSVQAQVLDLMQDLQEDLGLSYLFVSHDLSVIRLVSDRVAVMYFGRLVELATTDKIFENPVHPYTRALLSAVPVPDPRKRMRRILMDVAPPDPTKPPCGCVLFKKCPCDKGETLAAPAQLREIEPGHYVRCHQTSDIVSSLSGS